MIIAEFSSYSENSAKEIIQSNLNKVYSALIIFQWKSILVLSQIISFYYFIILGLYGFQFDNAHL